MAPEYVNKVVVSGEKWGTLLRKVGGRNVHGRVSTWS